MIEAVNMAELLLAEVPEKLDYEAIEVMTGLSRGTLRVSKARRRLTLDRAGLLKLLNSYRSGARRHFRAWAAAEELRRRTGFVIADPWRLLGDNISVVNNEPLSGGEIISMAVSAGAPGIN